MSEDKARGETKRHDLGAGSHRNNRYRDEDHHSPMKHSKRQMLRTMVKACLPAHYLVEVNSRRNARGEQKCEKSRRLYDAEM